MKKIIYLMIGASLMLQSCKTAYIPNALNVPLLQEKGEIKALLSPTNYQVAYAVSDKIGIIANGQSVSSSTTTTVNNQTTNSFTQNYSVFEAGVGYLGKTKKNLIYEIYGGAGSIHTHIYDNASGNYTAQGLKFFIQPNIGFTSNAFDFAFSTRFSGLQYGSPITTFSSQTQTENNLNQIANNTHLFLEPAITLRGGYKFVKLQAQFGASFKLSSADIPYNPFIGNLGLVFDIAQWYKH